MIEVVTTFEVLGHQASVLDFSMSENSFDVVIRHKNQVYVCLNVHLTDEGVVQYTCVRYEVPADRVIESREDLGQPALNQDPLDADALLEAFIKLASVQSQ